MKVGNIKERREGWEWLEQPEGSLVPENRDGIHPTKPQGLHPRSGTGTLGQELGQRHWDRTQPFLRALRGVEGSLFQEMRKCQPKGAAAHQDPSPSCSRRDQGWESHREQTLAKASPVVPLQSGKSSAWISCRKDKFIPEQALEQFSAPFPHRFGLFPVPSAVP